VCLIACIAGKDEPLRKAIGEEAGKPLTEEETRTELSARYRRSLAEARTLIRAAVIIDLSDGKGDAAALAPGWAGALGIQSAIALWNPQRAGR